MDIKDLKLELLERIALLHDEARLIALKRLLDGPRPFAPLADHLSVVKEGEAEYGDLSARTFSWEEVEKLLASERERLLTALHAADGPEISDEELTLLDARREQLLQGTLRSYSLAELEELLKEDQKR